MRASGRRGRRGSSEDDGFWSAFAATSQAERMHILTMQQNTGTQPLLKILQDRKKADGAVESGRGLADGMAGRGDVTVSCRATFLVFLIHQHVDAGLLWRFPGGTRGCEPPLSLRSKRSRHPLCAAGSRGPRAMLVGVVASRCGTKALWLFLEAMFQDPRSRVRAQTCRVATAAAFEYRTPAPDGDGWPRQSAARRTVEGCFPAVLGMCGDGSASAPWRGGRETTSVAAGAAGSGFWSHTRRRCVCETRPASRIIPEGSRDLLRMRSPTATCR